MSADGGTPPAEEAWTRFLSGEALGADERKALDAAVARDDVLHRRLLHDLRVHGALLAAGQSERDTDAFIEALRAKIAKAETGGGSTRAATDPEAARMRQPRVWVALATLGIAAAAALLLLPLRQPPPGAPGKTAIVRLVAGRAFVHGREGNVEVAGSSALRAGEWLTTVGADARATLTHADGSAIELEGDTVSADQVTAARGRRYFLARGRLAARIPTAADIPLELGSPYAVVSGSGRFRLDASDGVTRVEVQEGHARVAAVGAMGATDLAAGQFTLARAAGLTPAAAITASRTAVLLVEPDERRGSGRRAAETGDDRLKQRLERLGYSVTATRACEYGQEEASKAALVVLSSTVSERRLGAVLRQMPVPMLVLAPRAAGHLGLTGKRGSREAGPPAPSSDEIVVQSPGHPLAAGLAGRLRVLSRREALGGGAPGPEATIIASLPGGMSDIPVVFAYERGAVMPGAPAPARRVALFIADGPAVEALTQEGWRLFDAAASWAIGDAR